MKHYTNFDFKIETNSIKLFLLYLVHKLACSQLRRGTSDAPRKTHQRPAGQPGSVTLGTQGSVFSGLKRAVSTHSYSSCACSPHTLLFLRVGARCRVCTLLRAEFSTRRGFRCVRSEAVGSHTRHRVFSRRVFILLGSLLKVLEVATEEEGYPSPTSRSGGGLPLAP